ncbi:MAG: hypothetical protein H7239_02985 [Flavobacterium sp.]|nr:hypothetical protein [Flavobacterium sp.]
MKITIYALLFQFCIYGQTKEIISKFQFKSLPHCISYSESESDSTEVRNYNEVDSLSLSPEKVKKFFTPKRKSKLDQGFKGDYEYSFYAGNLIANKKGFYVLTYERMFSPVVECAETFLCTIDKKGNCISRVLIASSMYAGMGRFDDGQQFPYYEDVESCIEKNLIVKVKLFGGNEIKYQIKTSGEIVQLK